MPPEALVLSPKRANSARGKCHSTRALRRNRIGVLEDVEDYKGFEAAIIADFNAETAAERELVLRLASLLWRLRRATSIETEIFRIQAEILHERRLYQSLIYLRLGAAHISGFDNIEEDHEDSSSASGGTETARSTTPAQHPTRDLAHCFQRLVNLDGAAFEHLGRYERALSRQLAQTLFLLREEKRRRRGGHWNEYHARKPDFST
jgi:hypothetical protein